MKTTKHFLILLVALLISSTSFAQIGKCKGKYLGNIIAYSTPSNYTSLWNQVTSENGSKWGSIEGTKGTYNFSNSDLSYNWAKNNGGMFKYHTLVWGSQTPSWVETASTATIQTAIEDYIKAVANHYASMGGINILDVLNEPVNTAMPGNMKAALTAISPSQSQAHLQVAQTDTRPKPAKELAFPPHSQTENMQKK